MFPLSAESEVQVKMKPIVYVVNESYTSLGERRIDLSPAAEFGEIRVLVPGRLPYDYTGTAELLREKLREFRDCDYLLPVGDTIGMCVATTFAAQATGGTVNFLRWDGPHRRYRVVKIDLNLDEAPSDDEAPRTAFA